MFRQVVLIGALLAVGLALTAARPQQDADDTWLSAEDAYSASNDDLLLSLDVDLGVEAITDVFEDAVEDALPEPDSEDETVLVDPVEEQQQEPRFDSASSESLSSESSSEETKVPRSRPHKGQRRPNPARN